MSSEFLQQLTVSSYRTCNITVQCNRFIWTYVMASFVFRMGHTVYLLTIWVQYICKPLLIADFDNFLSKVIRAVDPDRLGSAFIVLPGSGSRRGKKKNIIKMVIVNLDEIHGYLLLSNLFLSFWTTENFLKLDPDLDPQKMNADQQPWKINLLPVSSFPYYLTSS